MATIKNMYFIKSVSMYLTYVTYLVFQLILQGSDIEEVGTIEYIRHVSGLSLAVNNRAVKTSSLNKIQWSLSPQTEFILEGWWRRGLLKILRFPG